MKRVGTKNNKPHYRKPVGRPCKDINCDGRTLKREYCSRHRSYSNYTQFQKARKARLELIGNRCEYCGAEKPSQKLHFHHIDGSSDNHDEKNLVLLCKSCHCRQHLRIWKGGSEGQDKFRVLPD